MKEQVLIVLLGAMRVSIPYRRNEREKQVDLEANASGFNSL